MDLTGKTIGELALSSGISDDSLFAIEQSGFTFQIPYSGFSSPVTTNPTLYNLPSPKLSISNGQINLQTLEYNNEIQLTGVTLVGIPTITPTDLTQEQINQGVWIEMLIYRRSSGSKTPNKKRGFVVPPPYVWDGTVGVNPLQQELSSLYPTSKIKNRGGITLFYSSPTSEPLKVSRPNHRKITDLTNPILLGDYLNGRFRYSYVNYKLPDASDSYIILPTPISRNTINSSQGNRFCYSSKLSPTYIKFRYLMYKSDENRFISGPLSETVKVTIKTFPFIPKDSTNINYNGAVCVVKNNINYTFLKSYIENNLP